MAAVENFVLKIAVQGQKAVDDLSKSISNVGASISRTQPLINGIIAELGGMGKIAGTAATAFVGLGLAALKLADDIADIANATGVSAGELLNFKQSIIEAGGSADDFATLASKLNQNLGDAAGGGEKAQKAFKNLGVFVTDSGGALRNTGDVLRDAISRLAAIEDPAKRAALAVDIFGKNAAKIDFTKLNAFKNPVTDEDIKQLEKYQGYIDSIRNSLERKVISFFAGVTREIDTYLGKLDSAEKKLNEQGRTSRAFVPGGPSVSMAMEPGSGPNRNMTEGEKQYLAALKTAESMQADHNREMERLKKIGQKFEGGYGGPSEAEIKALAASRLRLSTSEIEAGTNLALQGANDILAIQIKARDDLRKAANTIYAQEKISNKQMDAEYAAKKKEIESKAALDIAKFRSQQNAKAFSEEESQRQKIQDELAAEDERLNKLFETGRKITEQAAEQNKELSAKFKLALDSVMLTDRERQNAEELFKIEQDRLALLKQIADTYGDSEFAKRTAEEKKINELIAQRKTDAIANQEATARQQDDFGAGWEKAYRQYVENSRNGFNQAGAAFSTLSRGFEDSIVKFVQTGKLSFKDLFNDLIAQAVRAQSNKLLTSLLGKFGGSFFGSLFGGGGGAGAAVMGLPGYAAGGNIPAGQLSVVGERGPELFLPRSAGTIIPNGAGMGSTVNNTAVTYSIQAVDAQSFKSLLARDPEFIHNVAEQGRRSMPIRSRR
jgi:lambda family phage tail tape measure protein